MQDKSIAELENRFDLIKNTLADESYISRVFFKENDNGDIDVSDLLAVLNMFNIDRYNGMASFPINSYSSKKKCIDLYIADHKQYGESEENPYIKMTGIMPDIFRLYDAIEVGMNRFYRQKNPGGRYGSVKGRSSAQARPGVSLQIFREPLGRRLPQWLYLPDSWRLPGPGGRGRRPLLLEEEPICGAGTDRRGFGGIHGVHEPLSGEITPNRWERNRTSGKPCI